jgi:hypothetical protein
MILFRKKDEEMSKRKANNELNGTVEKKQRICVHYRPDEEADELREAVVIQNESAEQEWIDDELKARGSEEDDALDAMMEEQREDAQLKHMEAISEFKSRFRSIYRCGRQDVPLQYIWIHYTNNRAADVQPFVSLTGPRHGTCFEYIGHHHWSCGCGVCHERFYRVRHVCGVKDCHAATQADGGHWNIDGGEPAYKIPRKFTHWSVASICAIDACWFVYDPSELHEEARPILEIEAGLNRNLIKIINDYADKPKTPIGGIYLYPVVNGYFFKATATEDVMCDTEQCQMIIDYDKRLLKCVEHIDAWAASHWDCGYDDFR